MPGLRVNRSIVFLLLIALMGCSNPKPESQPLAPGQEWKYKHREGEQESRLIILKLENGADGTPLAHIAVTGLKTEDMTTVGHLPFTQKAVEQSTTELVGTVEYESEPEGYQQWRAAYDAGEAGTFVIPVSEALDLMTGIVEQSGDNEGSR